VEVPQSFLPSAIRYGPGKAGAGRLSWPLQFRPPPVYRVPEDPGEKMKEFVAQDDTSSFTAAKAHHLKVSAGPGRKPYSRPVVERLDRHIQSRADTGGSFLESDYSNDQSYLRPGGRSLPSFHTSPSARLTLVSIAVALVRRSQISGKSGPAHSGTGTGFWATAVKQPWPCRAAGAGSFPTRGTDAINAGAKRQKHRGQSWGRPT